MSTRTLKDHLNYWLQRIDLPEWSVTVRWMRSGELPGQEGGIEWYTATRSAKILISKSTSDLEWTLVHELCHLALEGHSELPQPKGEIYEQGINRLSRALVVLRRTSV